MPPMGFKPTVSAGERRLRPRGHWDRQVGYWYTEIRGGLSLQTDYFGWSG
jgi:hypothetical protein